MFGPTRRWETERLHKLAGIFNRKILVMIEVLIATEM
ncbi:hypothetical protein V474_16090 [Novosphingobium barchaimii LL02]|uniref:Uncharacterized protein n=1 Tax=Novosphingobium barchaimii LL02 TaxID=1114963 RepID=A0A0J7XZR2_9SPHN|nr:hypothetical protein V474_16090 [Novosphingobium barchaimii LL02]